MTIDAKTFWRCLAERAIGATVVTVDGRDGPAGFLGLSATHVSAEPPTLLVSIDRRTSACAEVIKQGRFAVNFLPADAQAIADAFGGRSGIKGADRFALGEWTTLETGAPVLRTALAAFDCQVSEVIDREQVAIVLGLVVAAASRGEGEPLILFRGATRG
jgi:flavin reductase (DIM6/NTAB) family NADH-FMN oxidoreductase RutF